MLSKFTPFSVGMEEYVFKYDTMLWYLFENNCICLEHWRNLEDSLANKFQNRKGYGKGLLVFVPNQGFV